MRIKNIYFDRFKVPTPSKWERIKLFFCRTYVSIDYDPNYSFAVFYKRLGNKIFIVGEERSFPR